MNLASEVIIFREGSAEPVMMTLMDPYDLHELQRMLSASFGQPPDELTIDGHGIAVVRYYNPSEATA